MCSRHYTSSFHIADDVVTDTDNTSKSWKRNGLLCVTCFKRLNVHLPQRMLSLGLLLCIYAAYNIDVTIGFSSVYPTHLQGSSVKQWYIIDGSYVLNQAPTRIPAKLICYHVAVLLSTSLKSSNCLCSAESLAVHCDLWL